MASFFGEILPGNSRAVSDFDEDEDIILHKECHLEWTEKVQTEIESSKCISCNTLIVAVGPTTTAFVEAGLIDEKPEVLATVWEGEDVTDREHHRPTLCRLHKHPDVLIYKGQANVLPEQAFHLATQLLEHIPTSANIIILCTQPIVDYKGELLSSEMRALRTGNFKHQLPCAFIETPNIIDGFPAQVLTHCQVQGRPGVLYTVFMENMYFDTSCVSAFRRILDVPPLTEIAKDINMSFSDVGKKADKYAQSHNFYT